MNHIFFSRPIFSLKQASGSLHTVGTNFCHFGLKEKKKVTCGKLKEQLLLIVKAFQWATVNHKLWLLKLLCQFAKSNIVSRQIVKKLNG